MDNMILACAKFVFVYDIQLLVILLAWCQGGLDALCDRVTGYYIGPLLGCARSFVSFSLVKFNHSPSLYNRGHPHVVP